MKIIFSFVYFILLQTAFCQQQKFIVSHDGTAKYKTIQSALNAVPSGNTKRIIIYIKRGIYKEVITVDATKNFITLIGDDATNTMITFNNHAGTRLANGDTVNTWTSATAFVYGNDLHAENLTFENNAGFTAGQAVALRVEGNRASFTHCRFVGNQDVLFLSGSGVKQYFKECHIEGTTDFIFGASTAVFESCNIYSKKNSHVTAASTNSIIPFGFVFFNCKLTADTGINKVSLGRPWSPTASVTYINCWLGDHIITEGWNNWKNPANEATARFSEYKSSGPGASPLQRVKWSKQLSDDEVKKYTIKNILGDWDPEKIN
jgi:pectinesterase